MGAKKLITECATEFAMVGLPVLSPCVRACGRARADCAGAFAGRVNDCLSVSRALLFASRLTRTSLIDMHECSSSNVIIDSRIALISCARIR